MLWPDRDVHGSTFLMNQRNYTINQTYFGSKFTRRGRAQRGGSRFKRLDACVRSSHWIDWISSILPARGLSGTFHCQKHAHGLGGNSSNFGISSGHSSNSLSEMVHTHGYGLIIGSPWDLYYPRLETVSSMIRHYPGMHE